MSNADNHFIKIFFKSDPKMSKSVKKPEFSNFHFTNQLRLDPIKIIRFFQKSILIAACMLKIGEKNFFKKNLCFHALIQSLKL